LDEAQTKGREWKDLIDSGVDPAAMAKPEPEVKPLILRDLWAEYAKIQHGRYSPGYAKRQVQDWHKFIEPAWGDMPVREIDSGMANRLLDLQTQSVSNKLQDMLSALWKFGRAYYPQENLACPTDGRVRFTLRPRERFITVGEAPLLGKAWAESKHPDKYMLLWLLLTGSRDGVCLLYNPAWLTGPDRMEFPENTPGLKKARFVVIPPLAQPLVRRFVPTTENRLCKLCRALAKAAGIPSFSPHDLRRSFATFGVDIGESDDAINSLLNHPRTRVTQSYLKRNVLPLVPVAERISSHIVSLLGIDRETWK
jgi:integrase